VEVTFDPAKNKINIKKHGISLERAEGFDLVTAFIDADNSQDYGEVRYNAIGWLDTLLHTLTFTEGDNKIHAISLRRATRQEQKTYAKQT
jgi:uncharacterized DUF497 family protein